jgi:UDP-glucose:(heptosyl)LPS alpha-1,3-glucosyltransferase
MKIALGIYRLAPRGGLEDHAIRIAEELARRGHQAVLHATGEIPRLDLPVVSIGVGGAATNHGRMAAFAREFQAAAAAGRFDRVVGFQPMPGLDILFLADHLRGSPDVPFLKRLLRRHRTFVRLEAACFGPGAKTRILGLARPQMQAFAKLYPESRARTVILPPTIKEGRRHPELRTAGLRQSARARFGVGEAAKAWLWLGLQPQIKGLDRAVEALASAPDAVLMVAGIAPDDRRLLRIERQAARLGVADRMRWLGYLSGDELFSAFAAADVLAHPARVDVTAAVILEALINGLPVVATAICGFAHHIEKAGAGKIVPEPFDGAVFARSLAAVCGPQNATFSANGIAYGRSPELYSGLRLACDLIEASDWPVDLTAAAEGPAWSR